MPSLNWIGKEAVANHDKEVPFKLLKKVKTASVGEHSQNLIIHGDNLEALKALMPYYTGQVKCIYIDPPYNTGNESWVYNDKVNSPKIKQWLGKVVGRESEDLTRHDDPFYIQGWKRGKFYPDFVAVTKRGAIIALEWKGEDRVSNEDTAYKTEIGELWAKLGGAKSHFLPVYNGNVEEILKKIKTL